VFPESINSGKVKSRFDPLFNRRPQNLLRAHPAGTGRPRKNAPTKILMNHVYYGSFLIENIADAFQFPGSRMIDSRIHQRQFFLLFLCILRRPIFLLLHKYQLLEHLHYTAERIESPP